MRDLRDSLISLNDRLTATVDRFERRIAAAGSKGSDRRSVTPPPLPSSRAHRPATHRLALPVRYRRGKPPTALDRLRQADERRHGGPTRFVAAARRSAARATDAIRRGLVALHDKLAQLRASVTGSRRAR